MGRSGDGGRVVMVMRSSDKEGERVQRLIGGWTKTHTGAEIRNKMVEKE